MYFKTELQLLSLQDTTRENKLRLLMILAAIYPDKFEGEKGLNLMKVGVLVTVYQPTAFFFHFKVGHFNISFDVVWYATNFDFIF
jgi:hypothetical protein